MVNQKERGAKGIASRGYFTQRNAVPGFTFLLILLIVNYTPLLRVIDAVEIQPLVGAVFGFFSIVTGSAIGAHLQSVWQWWFQYRGAHYDRKPYQVLIKKFGLKKGTDIHSKKRVIAFYGYFFHRLLGYPDTKQLVLYTQRRWDIFHTFAATKVSIYLGIFLGFVFRVLFVFKWNFEYSCITEVYIHKIFLICFVILILLLQKGIDWVLFQYDAISVALIKDPKNSEKLCLVD